MKKPIKRHPSLVSLSKDHHGSLLVAQMLKADVPNYKGMPVEEEDKMRYLLDHYNGHMKEHFAKEENILFPAVKGRDARMDELIEELEMEHTDLAHHILALPNVADKIVSMDYIGKKLDAHIRKEERVLFGMIQDVLSDDELRALEEKFDAGSADNQSLNKH